MIDRARPGLVTFCDIRPGNGAGLLEKNGQTEDHVSFNVSDR